MKLPDKIVIIGIPYTVVYCANAADVSPDSRDALWGHIDYWNREIRIFTKNKPVEEQIQTIIQEVIHGLCEKMYIRLSDDKERAEQITDMLAYGLADTLIGSGLIKLE